MNFLWFSELPAALMGFIQISLLIKPLLGPDVLTFPDSIRKRFIFLGIQSVAKRVDR